LIFLLISRFVEFSCQRILGLKSGAINQVTLGDQPVDHHWTISVFKLHFFWLEF